MALCDAYEMRIESLSRRYIQFWELLRIHNIMKTLTKTLFLAVLIVGANSLFAQDDAAGKDDKLVRKDFVASVGDTDSFGANVKWAGVTQSGLVTLGSDCTPDPTNPPGPDDRCVLLGPCPSTARSNLRDIGRITLPGNTANSVIYPVFQFSSNYQLQNTTGLPVPSALFRYVAYLTVESNALKDPRAIDPTTGLPMNGSVDIFFSARKTVNRSLAINERDREDLGYTRATIYAISKITMQSDFNLPKDIVDKMFREPIAIRLNVFVAARCVSDATLFYAVRYFSD
jgi:hypothetical protein